MRPAVFLDRDGVLNQAIVRGGKPYPPASVDELVIAPDASAALTRLREAGYRLVVVTNQPDVGRGTQRREVVDAINAALASALPLDEVRVCYHADEDRCDCRKPAPGLLLQAPAHDLARSVIVGDRWRDVEAGRRANVRAAVLIDRHYAEAMTVEPDVRVRSLSDAAEWILALDGDSEGAKRVSHANGAGQRGPASERAGELEGRSPSNMNALRVKIYADGASLADIIALYKLPYIRGFTTNPTLMHRAGVTEYVAFARDVLAAVPDRPISFEVLSDDFPEMERQAREIASWGENVYVKIPITNTAGLSSADLIHRLSQSGIKVNVTAVLTQAQVATAVDALAGGAAANVSLFAGRIADTGRDPVPCVRDALARAARVPSIELIWASPREVLNVVQADAVGCHIITVTTDILNKLRQLGRDLDALSLDTVRMFYEDAKKAGLTLKGLVQPT